MTDLTILSLDFDAIKENLKNHFKAQDYWKDYNFEGSGLDALISALAYDTWIKAFDASLLSREMFLDSATMRRNVVKLARPLGYVPRSITAAKVVANIVVEEGNEALPDTLILPKGTKFKSTPYDGKEALDFTVVRTYETTRNGNQWVFENVELRQGSYHITEFINDSYNRKQKFLLPNDRIDISLIEVYVQEGNDATKLVRYERHDDVIDVDANTRAFFIREDIDGRYEIYFGDGIIGKKLNHGALVRVIYFMTDGELGNGIDSLTFSASPTTDYAIDKGIVYANIYNPSAGGLEAESTESIKYLAPLTYAAYGRSVTRNDIIAIVQRFFPEYAVNVWGGEENDPPVYGKVFISMYPKDNSYLTDRRKKEIIDFLREKSLLPTITPEIVEPEIIHIKGKLFLNMDINVLNIDVDAIKEEVRNFLESYSKNELERFGSSFYFSKVLAQVDAIDQKIISSSMDFHVYRRFYPVIGAPLRTEINFRNALERKTLSSSAFIYHGETVYMDDDGNGKLRLYKPVNNEYVIVVSDAGNIDYERGIVSMNIDTFDGSASANSLVVMAKTVEDDVSVKGNAILKIDPNDIEILIR